MNVRKRSADMPADEWSAAQRYTCAPINAAWRSCAAARTSGAGDDGDGRRRHLLIV